MGGQSNPQWGPPCRTLRLYQKLKSLSNGEEERGGHESQAVGRRRGAARRMSGAVIQLRAVNTIAWSCTLCSNHSHNNESVVETTHTTITPWAYREGQAIALGREEGQQHCQTESSLKTLFYLFFLKGSPFCGSAGCFFMPSSPTVRKKVKYVVNAH